LDAIDVVFLDLEMPNYDGFNLLTDLKADARLSHVQIIAYTVHTSEIDEARQAGFDGFLGKPLDIKRFPDQLERILNRQPVWEI
jgi:two-component system cell cycle response regulator DivK